MSLENDESDNHDIDLEEAIASSLKSITQDVNIVDNTSQNQNKSPSHTDTPHESDDINSHEDFNSIIGDTINQLYLESLADTHNVSRLEEDSVQSNETKFGDKKKDVNNEKRSSSNDYGNNFISNELTSKELASDSKSELEHQREENIYDEKYENKADGDVASTKETNLYIEQDSDLDNDNDIDLADVIGNAFRDVMGESNQNEQEDHSSSYDISTSKLHQQPNETEEHTKDNNKEVEEKNSEFDLANVVGDAFQSLLGNSNEKDLDSNDVNYSGNNSKLESNLSNKDSISKDEHNTNQKSPPLIKEKNSPANDGQDFNSLQKVINEFDDSKSNEEVHNTSKELDLDEAIGNAFKSLIPDLPSERIEHKEEKLSDLDLELAIGDAFKSIQGEFSNKITDTSNLSSTNSSNDNEIDDNDELNAAISASLKEVTNQSLKDTNYSRNDVDTLVNNSSSSLLSSIKDSIQPVDFSNIVQNIVNQMGTSDDISNASVENPISEDILQELAQEITNQVQSQLFEDQLTKKLKALTNMPQIDDTVVDHFQYEAHKDENDDSRKNTSRLSEDSLQAALATVVRNAIENNATTLSETNNNSQYLGISSTDQHDSTDLEKLQMNDILQNAFNMAMENPHDLLSNLEMADDDTQSKPYSVDEKGTENPASILSKSFKATGTLPNSTSMFLESLNRSNDIDLNSAKESLRKSLSKSKSTLTSTPNDRLVAVAKNIMSNIGSKVDESKRKSMSIAETLALHRSSMSNGNRRDYSSIESLEEALKSESYQNLSFNSKVSSVLSSLSSRIHATGSGAGTENNLLQVIRQMTNTLTSSSQSNLYSGGGSTAADIISSYKGGDNEKSIVNSLLLAKRFLSEKQFNIYNDKAISLINNVLTLFNPSITPEFNSKEYELNKLPNIKTEIISSISNSVISAISTYSSSKGTRSSFFLGEKPKVDSPEYKERIRLENRERKKKWREENSERNKDNDLRSRVLKRAAAIFGDSESQEKRAWVDDEFNRRRDKRIAKQKKDEQDKQNKQILDDNNSKKQYKDKESNSLASDPNLIKPVSDIFNIITGLTYREDPQAALAATSAATATAAAIYANNNDQHDLKVIDGAVSIILSSLMENPSSGTQQERFSNLSRGITSSFKVNSAVQISSRQPSIPSLPSRLPDPELSSLIKGSSSSSSILNRLSSSIKGLTGLTSENLSSSLLKLQRFNLDDGKRKANETLQFGDLKKPKLEVNTDSNQTSDNEKESISKIASNLDHIRSTITSTSSHLWSNLNTLKMPQYRRPDSSGEQGINLTSIIDNPIHQPKREYTSIASPFISHKVGFGKGMSRGINNPGTDSKIVPGLKKPGSFQRPSYKKPDKSKSRSLGFPPLYSTSFTLNNN